MKYLALISGIMIIFAVSLMLSGCSRKAENYSKKEKKEQPVQTEQLSDKHNENIWGTAYPAVIINNTNNTSAGVKENAGNKKTGVKTEEKLNEPEVPEVKPATKTKDPRLADDSAMDPKNKFPENYNGK